MPTNKERDEAVILEIFKNRYQQVQHLQQMRASYFNIYIAVIGFSVTAIFSFGGDGLTAPWAPAVLYPSLLIWIISIFSIMRAERWGGHISHDLNAIRKIQNFFARRYKSVEGIIPINDSPLTSIEFDRPLWNRNRGIETPIFMTSAILSALMTAYFISSSWELKMALGVFLVACPVLVWRAEVSNLLKRHARCCLSSSKRRKL